MEKLCDSTENVDTRGSAEILTPIICNFNFLGNLQLGCNIREEVNHTQKCKQTEGITLDKTI